jgi:ATP-dependent helicase HrpA
LLKGQDIALTFAAIGTRAQVVDDLILAAIKQIALEDPFKIPRSLSEFDICVTLVRDKLIVSAQELSGHLLSALTLLLDVKKSIKQQKKSLALTFTLGDIQLQLQQLFFVGLVYKTSKVWLSQYPRYLRAIQLRLEKAVLNPQKDKLALAEIQSCWVRYETFLQKSDSLSMQQTAALEEYRWWVEELRVSLFAQSVKTLVPISLKRLDKQWELVLER